MKTITFAGSIIVGVALSAFPAQAANLNGSLTAGPQTNVDLTTMGTEDWALWGYAGGGTSTNLAPDVSKAGGTGISDLTYLNPHSQPLRGLGQFAINFGFSWTNGDTTVSATGAHAGLQEDTGTGPGLGINEGFSFTVPADLTERTVTVYVDEHEGIGQLTATLSDSSAAPYVNSSLPSGSNSPGVYTINYAAASAGQLLTIKWIETGDTDTFDNSAIYAVTLSEVPEPSSFILLGLGAAGAVFLRRKSK